MKRIIFCLLLPAFVFTGCNMGDDFTLIEEESEVITRAWDPNDYSEHHCYSSLGNWICDICGKTIPNREIPIPEPQSPYWHFQFAGYKGDVVLVEFSKHGGNKVLSLISGVGWTLDNDPNVFLPSEDIRLSLHNSEFIHYLDLEIPREYPPLNGSGSAYFLIQCAPGDTYETMWYEIIGSEFYPGAAFWKSIKICVKRIGEDVLYE